MANANTIAMAPRAAVGGGTAAGTTETVFVKASATSSPAVVYLPGSGKLDNKAFRVRARGKMTGGTTTNFTIALYYGTSATVGSDTLVATSAATACNSASSNFELIWEGSTDATSKILNGRMNGRNNATAIALAAASGAPTAVNPATEGNGFVASYTFSASNAGNVVTLDELSIEQI
jgi:hypothetical protein